MTAKGDRKIHVLSLDGGGVRGLSSMVILENLISLVAKNLVDAGASNSRDTLLPAELFDHIVGTSTGGLIAVMLVKLNMSIKECITTYKKLIPRIFRRKQFGSCIGGLGIPRYSEANFQKCLQEVFGTHGRRKSGDVIKFMEEGNIGGNRCYCTVMCRELYTSGRRMPQPAFICSHYCRATQRETGKYIPYELWMICRATTAAPTFFARMSIHGRTFVDGAFGNTNNPSRKAHFHFLQNVPEYKDSSVVWLNIGTGSPKANRDTHSFCSQRTSQATHKPRWHERLLPKAILEARNLLQDLEAIATDSDRVEEEMEDIINSKSTEQHITFTRVSANNGVAEVQLDDWRGLDLIEELTNLYLQNPDVQQKLQRVADVLSEETIRRRKLRAQEQRTPELPPQIAGFEWLDLLYEAESTPRAPSPLITLSRPGRESQHTANLAGLSPIDPSPVSPLSTTETKSPSTQTTLSPIAPSSTTSSLNTRHCAQPLSISTPPTNTDLNKSPCPATTSPEEQDISPVLIQRPQRQGPQAVSRATKDLVASMSALPGMSVPNERNEKRFSNIGWNRGIGVGARSSRTSDVEEVEIDEKWKRRTTVF